MKVCQTCRRCYEDDAIRCVDNTHSPPLEEVRVPLELGGRWRIERLVSGTDWAAEFVGRHIELGRPVSIRVSTAEGPADAWLKRARLAARSLAAVRHEHVARLEDFGSIPAGGAYAAVERFGDESLREAIDRVGPLPVGDAVRIGRQVAEALAALAAKAIAPAPRALLAEEIRIGRDDSQAPVATVTQYPNRDRGETAQLVPALGGLLSEMLLGRPFTAGAFGNPEPIGHARPDLPEELAALVDASVRRSPAAPSGSIAEMAQRLRGIEGALKSGESDLRPAPVAEPPSPEPAAQTFFRAGPSATAPAASFPPPPSPEDARPAEPDLPPAPPSLPVLARAETVAIATLPPPKTAEPEAPAAASPPPQTRVTPPPMPPVPAAPSLAAAEHPLEARGSVSRLDEVPLGPGTGSDDTDASLYPARRRFPGGVASTLLAGLAVATAAAVWFTIETMPAHRPPAPAASVAALPTAEPSKAASPQPTPAPPEHTPTPTPAPAAAAARPTPPDPAQSAVRAALDGWVSSTNSRNLSEQMRYYMPRLSVFYQQRNVSRDLVRRVKSGLFALGPATIQVRDPEVTLTNDRRAATTRFRKDYDVEGASRSRRRGSVVQELKWVRSDAGWKIVSERDTKATE